MDFGMLWRSACDRVIAAIRRGLVKGRVVRTRRRGRRWVSFRGAAADMAFREYVKLLQAANGVS